MANAGLRGVGKGVSHRTAAVVEVFSLVSIVSWMSRRVEEEEEEEEWPT